jgi:membrane protease YdiL (CAAX protease family)
LLPARDALGPEFLAHVPSQLHFALLSTGPFSAAFWLCGVSKKDNRLLAQRTLFHQPRPLFHLLCFATAAAVGEEILFRGLLQSVFIMASVGNNTFALSVSSILSGMLHGHRVRYAVLTTVAGFMFGSMSLSYNSVLASVLVHALYDYVAIMLYDYVVIVLLRPQWNQEDVSTNATRLAASTLEACELGYGCNDEPLRLS